MTLAAAASRARSVLALALLVVAALLAVLNPWLAVFAVAGFALGWVVRNPRRLVRCISASVASVRHFRKSRSRLTAGLVGLVSLAVVVLVGVSLTEEQFSFRITTVAPVSYSAKATLDTEREAFVLLERLVVPRESLRLARIDAAPKKPEDFVAQLLVKGGGMTHVSSGEHSKSAARGKARSRTSDASRDGRQSHCRFPTTSAAPSIFSCM